MEPAPCPNFLILPVAVYNRITSLKRMLLDGFRRPICPDIGWRVSIPPEDDEDDQSSTAEQGDTDGTPSWAQWTGLECALTSPCNLTTKVDPDGAETEVRLVFVRRQSDDCGDAISLALKKSIFGREFHLTINALNS